MDEARTFYRHAQPEPDRGNPFFEFDPQMCIICTRCVRACDDLRHTTAITLAGRGFTTRIAFGAGGRSTNRTATSAAPASMSAPRRR